MKINVFILSFLVSFVSLLALDAAETTQTDFTITASTANDTNSLNGYVCGQATNGIAVAIKFFNSSHSNIMACLLSTSQVDRNQLWIAPPQFQRIEYYLYDSSQKVVPYLAAYHPANRSFKTISDAPKNVHNVHEGTMWPPFSMPYEQNTLTDIFQIEHGGDYRLVAKGRIMKIKDDGSLSVMEFPPVSLPIHLRDEDVETRQQIK
jgi:hypothetical protein